jgi:hypothetical protein
MRAVQRLRVGLPAARIDVAIVSAGFGLVGENDLLSPYDATFVGMSSTEAIQRGRTLAIRSALAQLLPAYEDAIFLLGREYLAAIEAPLATAKREVYLTAQETRLTGPGVVSVPTSKKEALLLGVAPRLAKAEAFARLADAAVAVGWTAAVDRLRRGDLCR